MPLATDQTGRTVPVPDLPRRIISLVPSQTELLYTLGLDTAVCGVTKFCVHPEHWFRTKPRVGGTKNLQLDTIRSLQPDLIIANKEENQQEQIEALAAEFPVWVSDPKDLPSALDMIHSIGQLTGKTPEAAALTATIQQAFAGITLPRVPLKTVYLIWQEPLMTVGGDTFIHAMLQSCGLENLSAASSRYPQLTLEQLQELQPELLLLSSEPYPFKHPHLLYFREALPNCRVLLADGEYFSWYGSRMRDAPAYFRELLGQML